MPARPAPRTTVRRCWCGRPINDPDAIECAEHDQADTAPAAV